MPSPHLYTVEGRRLGIDVGLLDRAVRYRQATSANGAFPLLTLRHLAYQTRSEYGYLRRIVERRISPYVSLEVPKSDGHTRPIRSPEPALMSVQRWILKNVLSGLTVHDSAFAYRRGRSVKLCADAHVGARWLIKMDIHDFFGAIGEKRVYRELLGLGYPPLLSFEMGRIVTNPIWYDAEAAWLEDRGIENYGSPQLGSLPQGAPTSGALANAVARSLDIQVAQIAETHGMQYTRYSDDIVLSSPGVFDRGYAAAIVRLVEEVVRASDFQVHRRKTTIVPPGARKVVLGLIVHEDRVRLRPEFRRHLQNHIRCVHQYGPAEHARMRSFRSALSMINHVEGGIAYASDIEPEWALDQRTRWSTALAKHGHPLSVVA